MFEIGVPGKNVGIPRGRKSLKKRALYLKSEPKNIESKKSVGPANFFFGSYVRGAHPPFAETESEIAVGRSLVSKFSGHKNAVVGIRQVAACPVVGCDVHVKSVGVSFEPGSQITKRKIPFFIKEGPRKIQIFLV